MVNRVRWTEDAVAQLTEIVTFLSSRSESLARRVATELYEQGEALATMSHRGRLGPVPGTREWVSPKTGYILTYEVLGDAVFISGIHHGAQNRPGR